MNIMLSGSVFNEYGKIRNYTLVGWFDETTHVFTGIEAAAKDIKTIKQLCASKEVSLVTGIKEDRFSYYTYHKEQGISCHRLRKNGDDYFGKEITFKDASIQSQGNTIEIKDILFQSAGEEQHYIDPELDLLILGALEEKNLVWKGIKNLVAEKANAQKEKQYQIRNLHQSSK